MQLIIFFSNIQVHLKNHKKISPTKLKITQLRHRLKNCGLHSLNCSDHTHTADFSRNQQTRELINARMTSHKHINEDFKYCGTSSNSKHWFTTSFLPESDARSVGLTTTTVSFWISLSFVSSRPAPVTFRLLCEPTQRSVQRAQRLQPVCWVPDAPGLRWSLPQRYGLQPGDG